MSTAWTTATKILATTALAAASALAIGCGPAPGYEAQEPRVPVGYTPIDGPEPATSEELAARAQAAQQDPTDPQALAASGSGDIALGADNTQYTDTDPSALTEFKPVLEGHGQWVDDPTYGTVWVPATAEVGTDFVPYTTGGHWTYSDDTNYVWVSDYSWGWAPFHYGRWAHVGPRGWVWIPGRTYAGAWVSWRTGPGYDYVGWAPLGPDWYWRDGYAYGWGWGWSPYYSYCNRGYLYDGRLGGHIVRGPDYDNHTRPYVASAPMAGGGGGGAGGRTPANPSVGAGGGRSPASPTVGNGRTLASATVGPKPAELGIRSDAVVAPPKDNAGLTRASALASPSTAVAHGAAPPSSSTVRRRDPSLVATSANAHPGTDGRVSTAPSSRFDAAARAPQVQGVAPSSRPSSSFAGRGSTMSAPAYRSAPSYSPSVAPHSSPSYSPSPSYGGGAVHSGPTVAHGTVAAPAYHPSAPSAPHSTVRAPSRGKR